MMNQARKYKDVEEDMGAHHGPVRSERQKPSVDEWKNMVGAMLAVSDEVRRNGHNQPEVSKAFAIAARALATPYMQMHRDVSAIVLNKEFSATESAERVAKAENTGIARMCGAALLASEVTRAAASLTPQGDFNKLEVLAVALDSLIQREVNGGARKAHDGDFIRHVRQQAGRIDYDRLLP
jgi:hypothetical protein